jgi:hypothetical protein
MLLSIRSVRSKWHPAHVDQTIINEKRDIVVGYLRVTAANLDDGEKHSRLALKAVELQRKITP